MGNMKVWGYFVFFTLLSLFSTFWILKASNFSWHLLKNLLNVPAPYLILTVFAALLVFVFDALRYLTYAWALGEKLSFKNALEATTANFFFSWITPAAILGMPATIFILNKRGVKLENAVLISTGKSIISSALILMFAFVLIYFGLGPPRFEGGLASFIMTGAGVYISLLLLPFFSAFYPAPFYKLIKKGKDAGLGKWPMLFLNTLENAIKRLEMLLTHGRWWIVPITLAHVFYYAAFIGTGVFLAMGLSQASLISLTGPMTVFTAVSLVSPTPGGAGVAEAMIKMCFVPLLNEETAILTAVGFRALTFYFQTTVGLVWFIRLMLKEKNLFKDLDKAL